MLIRASTNGSSIFMRQPGYRDPMEDLLCGCDGETYPSPYEAALAGTGFMECE
ncbi:MAG: hypothetical protein GY854_08975 [Deltaproteobacteria bacterium]|nr:hypothetical protein [Deltaproteobacteria bacterium]